MHLIPRATLAGLAAVVLCGCANTHVTRSWVDPAAPTPLQFKKVAVVFLSEDKATRHVAEETLVKYVTRTEAIPSYTVLPASMARDVESAKARLREVGVDGVVVMRVLVVDKQIQVTPPSVSYSRMGYGWGMSPMVSPGSVRTDTSVMVETSVYSLADEKLHYSASSATVNPDSLLDTVEGIADAVGADLAKHGLIPPR